jgi:hypothetical protein
MLLLLTETKKVEDMASRLPKSAEAIKANSSWHRLLSLLSFSPHLKTHNTAMVVTPPIFTYDPEYVPNADELAAWLPDGDKKRMLWPALAQMTKSISPGRHT